MVILSSHKLSIDWKVRSFACTVTIGVHIETELVASVVGINRWTKPLYISSFLPTEIINSELYWCLVVQVLWWYCSRSDGSRRLGAYWVVLFCDDSERVVVTTFLTWDHSLIAVTCVLFHVTRTSMFTTAKWTSDATFSVSRITVVLEVSQFTNPLTPFLVIWTAYFDIFDFSLVIFVEYSIFECIWFMTWRAH